MARDVRINIGAANSASAHFAKLSRDVTKLSRDIKRLAANAGQSLNQMGASITRVGRNASIAGGVVTLGFASAVKTFAEFDDAMFAVSAKSGAVGADLQSLRDKAKELGSSTKFSASEAASGMEFLAQAGFKTNQIMASIGPSLSLAAAGGVELSEAADIASNVAGGFGLGAEGFQRVADVMARAATSANTDILMMGETFTHSAAVARAAGQSIEETAAAVGILANSGIQASVAGTDIKNMLANLATNSAQKKLTDLGVTVRDSVTGEFRPMLDILEDFGVKTANMNGPDKLAIAIELFGKRSAKSALVLAAAGDEIDLMRGKMNDASVTADSMAETMLSGLGGVGIKIKSAMEGVKIAIGETFDKELRVAGDRIQQFLATSTQWVADNKELVKSIGMTALVVTGLGGGLVALGIAVSLTGSVITGFTAILGLASIAKAALSVASGVASIAMTAFGTVSTIVTAALAGVAVEAGIASTAITVLGALLSAAGTAIVTVFAPATLVVVAASAAIGLFGAGLALSAYHAGVFGQALRSVTTMIKSTWKIATQAFSGISDAIKANNWGLATQIAWAGVKLAFWNGLRQINIAMVLMMPRLWVTVKNFFTQWITAAKDSAFTIAQIIANPLKGFSIANNFLANAFKFDGKESGGIVEFVTNQTKSAQAEFDKLRTMAREQSNAVAKETLINTPVGDLGKKQAEIEMAKAAEAAKKAADFANSDAGKLEAIKLRIDAKALTDAKTQLLQLPAMAQNAWDLAGAGLSNAFAPVAQKIKVAITPKLEPEETAIKAEAKNTSELSATVSRFLTRGTANQTQQTQQRQLAQAEKQTGLMQKLVDRLPEMGKSEKTELAVKVIG